MCLAAIRKATLFGVDVDGLQQLLFSSTINVFECEQMSEIYTRKKKLHYFLLNSKKGVN
jgi:hypothetical protein